MCQISSLVAAAISPLAEFSSFANFEVRKRKSNLLMSFPKIVHRKGSFGQIRKKIAISLLSTESRYFRIYSLKLISYKVSSHEKDPRVKEPFLNVDCLYIGHYSDKTVRFLPLLRLN